MADGNESWKNKDEEEEDDEIDESAYTTPKDAVLFAIDVSKSMLAAPPPSDSKNAETDCPTLAAIKCAYQIMQQRIISNPSDMMGVLLFNTEESKFQEDSSNGNLSYPHCYLLTDLNVPSAADVRALKDIVENEPEARRTFLKPTNDDVNMPNLLFCANQIFTRGAPDFGTRRLFVITDKDDPHAASKALRDSASVRAKDLYDLGVTIELFPISHPDHGFDRTKFYDNIIYQDPVDEGINLPTAPRDFKSSGGDGISLLNDLISDINSKQFIKRSLFSNIPLEIGPDFKISVKGYNILQKAEPKRQGYVYQGGEVAQMAQSKTEQRDEDTNEITDKESIKKAYKFGGSQIFFSPEEQKELRNWHYVGIRIIGFKPQSMLPFWASVKKSTFIYPSEEGFIGSTRVFSALWQKLLKDKTMGIAWFCPRSNAIPLLAAILPSKERLAPTKNVQLNPAGLWLYPLPFADDIRSPPSLPAKIPCPEELTDEMRKIVQNLQLPKGVYDPRSYPNPALQWHYKVLQVMALNDELPEKPDDKTVPKHRQVHKRTGEFIHHWGQMLEVATTDRATHKREREDSEGPDKKKVKNESLEGASAEDVREMVRTGKLLKYNMADLKAWLGSKGLGVGGKKQELVDRIEGWAEDN